MTTIFRHLLWSSSAEQVSARPGTENDDGAGWIMRLNRIVVLGASGVVLAALAGTTLAHHSHGNYSAAYTDIEGIVKEVHLINPHSWVYIEVNGADASTEIWALEAASRGQLERIGVTGNLIKSGDGIKVRCHPLRDGSRGCLLGFVKTEDGSITDWDGTNLPLPADF